MRFLLLMKFNQTVEDGQQVDSMCSHCIARDGSRKLHPALARKVHVPLLSLASAAGPFSLQKFSGKLNALAAERSAEPGSATSTRGRRGRKATHAPQAACLYFYMFLHVSIFFVAIIMDVHECFSEFVSFLEQSAM